MRDIKVLGIDLAKNVFQLDGADVSGKGILSKRLSREKLIEFTSNCSPYLIGIEACGGSHYWARLFTNMGHTVKIMSPQFVKPSAHKDKSCEPVKQTFGSISNYFVNLNHQGKGDIAYFTEGLETELSILQANEHARVSAVLGKANFSNIDPKNSPKQVIICLDNDGKDTYKYAKNEQTNTIIKAAQRLHDSGIHVSIMIPKKENTDLNDVLVKEGKDELKKQLDRCMSLEEFKKQCALENKESELKKINQDKQNQSLIKNEGHLP